MTTVSPPPRLAVVTGADSGIGKATAELLATEGFDVGITFHTDEAGAEDTRAAIEERGQRCFVARQDLTSPDAADVVAGLASELGGIGVLVNNAGTGHSDPVLDLDLDTWRRVIATDLEGPFLCAQQAARAMTALLPTGVPERSKTSRRRCAGRCCVATSGAVGCRAAATPPF